MFEPKLLHLETTNRCNAQCSFCPKRYDISEPRDMELSLFKKIVDAFPSAERLEPNMIGEPLLYPHIVEAISYAKKKGKNTVMYTNASLLDGDMAEKILDTKIDEIRFSVDGHDKDSYEKLRVGLNWETVLGNIENFGILKKKGGYKTKTMIRITVTKQNEHIIKEITSFWKLRVDRVKTAKVVNILSSKELLDAKPDYKKPIKCNRPFVNLSVKSNGDLVLCCRDYYHSYVVANLYEDDPREAFNNKKINQIREAMLQGMNYPKLCGTCWRR